MQKGFTLVEMIIAITIMAVITGVTFTGLFVYVNKANLTEDYSNLKEMQDVMSSLSLNPEYRGGLRGLQNGVYSVSCVWSDNVNRENISFSIGDLFENTVNGTSNAQYKYNSEIDSQEIERLTSVYARKLFSSGLPKPKSFNNFKLIITIFVNNNSSSTFIVSNAYAFDDKNLVTFYDGSTQDFSFDSSDDVSAKIKLLIASGAKIYKNGDNYYIQQNSNLVKLNSDGTLTNEITSMSNTGDYITVKTSSSLEDINAEIELEHIEETREAVCKIINEGNLYIYESLDENSPYKYYSMMTNYRALCYDENGNRAGMVSGGVYYVSLPNSKELNLSDYTDDIIGYEYAKNPPSDLDWVNFILTGGSGDKAKSIVRIYKSKDSSKRMQYIVEYNIDDEYSYSGFSAYRNSDDDFTGTDYAAELASGEYYELDLVRYIDMSYNGK